MNEEKQLKVYTPPTKQKRDIKSLARYSVKMLLQEFGKTLNTNDTKETLQKLMNDRPKEFFELYIKLLGKVDITEQTEEVKDARGLLNALQTGRLAEELAQVVRSAKKNMNDNVGQYNFGNTTPIQSSYTLEDEDGQEL
jgi:hypothetical protein